MTTVTFWGQLRAEATQVYSYTTRGVCVAFFVTLLALFIKLIEPEEGSLFFLPAFFLTFLFCVIQLSHRVGLIISSSGQA